MDEKISFEEEVLKWTPGADNGEANAAFNLAQTFMDEAARRGGDAELYGKCIPYLWTAAKAGVNSAWYQLGVLTAQGFGKRPQSADAVAYLKRYIDNYDESEDREEDLARACCGLAEMVELGEGTRRDIPLAYSYIRKAKSLGAELANELEEDITAVFPFDSMGEIDLGTRKRSGFSTFLMVIGLLGCVWGFVMPQLTSEAHAMFGTLFYIGMGLNTVAYAGTLFWQRWGGWMLLVKLLWAPLMIYGTFHGLNSMEDLTVTQQFCISQVADPILILFIFIALQKRIKGYALPFCSLMGIRDDGRNMITRFKDLLMAYGEGDAYRTHSVQSRTFVICCGIATAIVVAMAAYVGYSYITSDRQWGMDIEWRCWHSPNLWGFLSIIGFFLQFKDWQHYSYDTYHEYKDEWGNKKLVKDNDIMQWEMGNILFPALMHLLVVPAGIGAMLYYLIMGAIALLGALIPWVAAVLCLASSVLFFVVARHFYARRWRVPLLIVWLAIFLFVLFGITLFVKGAPSQTPISTDTEVQEAEPVDSWEPESDEDTYNMTDEESDEETEEADTIVSEIQEDPDALIEDNQIEVFDSVPANHDAQESESMNNEE